MQLQVLKRRRADGSPLIQVDQLRDGIVLFEDVADAERYSNYMEAESNAQVSAISCVHYASEHCKGHADCLMLLSLLPEGF